MVNPGEAEPRGIIFDIDHFAVHDGPGIRSVIYLKGCPLRCLWCHSPESQKAKPEQIINKEKCMACASCDKESCPHEARRICGRFGTVDDVIEEILPQKTFFDSSSGGVTLSGGDPLHQPAFIKALLQRLKAENIHTIIETSMMCNSEIIKEIIPFADMFYCDIKMIDPTKHKKYTGCENEVILSNIELLSKAKKQNEITIRVPLIPGYTDDLDDIIKIFMFAKSLGLSEIHLLPYNQSAPSKYEWLSLEYPPGVLKRQSAEKLNELLSAAPSDLNVTII